MTKLMMRRKLSEALFAVWDTHLYLDTHPNDEDMLSRSEEYLCTAQKVVEEYERVVGPISAVGSDIKAYLCGPWPWEPIKGDC